MGVHSHTHPLRFGCYCRKQRYLGTLEESRQVVQRTEFEAAVVEGRGTAAAPESEVFVLLDR